MQVVERERVGLDITYNGTVTTIAIDQLQTVRSLMPPQFDVQLLMKTVPIFFVKLYFKYFNPMLIGCPSTQ